MQVMWAHSKVQKTLQRDFSYDIAFLAILIESTAKLPTGPASPFPTTVALNQGSQFN